jgi:Ser/Thr protein kinase RdoA (MazF antagonist)
MEQRIRDRYSDEIFHEAMRRYGIAVGDIKLLAGFESYMYEFVRGDESYILRIGHSLRRSEALIQAEVHWLNYLAAGGASVHRAVDSKQRRLVETISDGSGGHFLATAFSKAQGKPPREVGWTPKLYAEYGELLGRMHVLSREYDPPPEAARRPHWDEPTMLEVERFLPESDGRVAQRYRELLGHLEGLPRDRDVYGLIHQEAHSGNMFIDKSGRITLFDFDDCAYSWYANDIAIVLFYMIRGRELDTEFVGDFLENFLRGYKRESRLDPVWLAEMPHFLKLREIDLYAVIHRSFDVNHLDPWCADFMANRKARLEDDVPYVEFDFERLRPWL